ncbi:Gfo/Idh/MocA family protein [Butyricicoccus sp.]|uniref:Gfo/Idh/MocA family protein n=1 Tax=Butyricicoccus sp. TaxID=2049021 RepID=UPI003F1767D2
MELKIGVIGCGAIGKEHIKRLQYKLQGCTVVAVSDVMEAGAQAAAELAGGVKYYTDIPSIVNDPEVDALVVCSPGFAHKEAVLAAIAAGKPVFTEKPLATTAADCKDIVDAEMASGRHLVQVGFMRRYDRGYNQVKAILDSGDFGQPLILKCTHRNPEVGTNYDTPMAVHDTAIHEIDVLHWLINDEYVSAQVLMPRTTKYSHPALRDPQIMVLKTKSGVIIDLEVFVNCKFGYDINCEVICEEGVVHMPAPSFPSVRKNGYYSTPIEQSWINRFIDSYDVELQNWVDCAKRGVVEGPTAWDGYVAAVTADALVKSQTTGAEEPILTGDIPAFYLN